MGNRYADWLRQADADLRHARNSLEDSDYEWGCFASHQAAEKALKAVFLKQGMDAWGHTLTVLIGNFPKSMEQPSEILVDYARDRISDYLPLGFPMGVDLFTHTQTEFEHLRQSSPGWYQAITTGVDIRAGF